jgi:hypothetical protein
VNPARFTARRDLRSMLDCPAVVAVGRCGDGWPAVVGGYRFRRSARNGDFGVHRVPPTVRCEALGSERSRGCRRADHDPLRCTAHGTEPCAQENPRDNGLTTNARESGETDGSPGADGRSKLAGHKSFQAITGYPRNLPVDSSGPCARGVETWGGESLSLSEGAGSASWRSRQRPPSPWPHLKPPRAPAIAFVS